MNGSCTVAYLGDSITYERSARRSGVACGWAEQVAVALGERVGGRRGDGYRGLWRDDEWQRVGAWTRVATTDPFDVAPFRQGYYSSGASPAVATWTKPTDVVVGSFDLYWFHMPGTGRWQFCIDDGKWLPGAEAIGEADNRLHRFFVDHCVRSQVRIRGHDGTQHCIAPIAGIATYRSTPDAPGALAHNVGQGQQLLAAFCRQTKGDPLALLDDLRPDLVTVMFSNDVRFRDVDRFARSLDKLLTRVSPYADALVMAPFEQRPPRVVYDAVTVEGSPVVESANALFTITDERAALRGDNVAKDAAVASVESAVRVVMDRPAIGTKTDGELCIGRARNASMQSTYRAFTRAIAERAGCAFIDLYDAWTSKVGPGWSAAYAAGLMFDGLHPSQLGHDDIASRVMSSLGLLPSAAH
jgi:hypothetical protein